MINQTTKTLLLALAMVLCSGCHYWECHAEKGDFCVNGILVEGLPTELQTADVNARLSHEMDVALAYWDHDVSAIKGWKIVYVPAGPGSSGGSFPCTSSVTGYCGGNTDPWEHTITLGLDGGNWKDCPEWAALPHELGHAVQYDSLLNLNGDHDHNDGRFRTFQMITHEVIQDNIEACKGAAYYLDNNQFWNIHPGKS